jgi:hypothetical protein
MGRIFELQSYLRFGLLLFTGLVAIFVVLLDKTLQESHRSVVIYMDGGLLMQS